MATCPAPGDPSLIDDMGMTQTDGTGTLGSWYTYSDRTNFLSEPPQVQDLADGATPVGSIMPVEGASFPSNATGPGMITTAREVSGGGENNWGAGFGFDFYDDQPDGAPTLYNTQCEAGPTVWNYAADAGSTGIPKPIDASAHTGVTFWLKSNTSASQKVNIQLSDKDTNPWGGVCDPCVSGGVHTPPACSDDYLVSELVPTTWTQYTIRWADKTLKTVNWSQQGLKAGAFDASSLYYLHFQFSTNQGVTLPNFDLSVACIQWVDN